MAGLDRRVPEIDGIRGWAAMIVLLFHFYQEAFGRLFPGLHAPGWGFLFDGRLAVLVFFVLSGDALSACWFRDGDHRETARLVISRYFRLTFPVAVTCLAVYLLMVFGLACNIEAGRILRRGDWIGGHIAFPPSFLELLEYTFSDLLFEHRFKTAYNPFLWILETELFGSLLVFAMILVLPQVRNPMRFLAGACAVMLVVRTDYAPFLMGMFFGALRTRGHFARLQGHRLRFLAPVALVAVIVLISLIRESKQRFLGIELADFVNPKRVHALWAILIVYLIYSSRAVVSLFRTRLSHFLGEISFPVYAVQFPVIVSLTSYLVIRSEQADALDGYQAFYIGTLSIAACVLVAIPLRLVERRLLRWMSGLVSRHVLKPRETPPPTRSPMPKVAREIVVAG